MSTEKVYQDINAVVRAFPKIEDEVVQHAIDARKIHRGPRDFTRDELSLYIKAGKRATDYLVGP